MAGKDVKEVDNDYFLIPVSIKDHEGPLRTTFPIENRLLPQGELGVISIMARQRMYTVAATYHSCSAVLLRGPASVCWC